MINIILINRNIPDGCGRGFYNSLNRLYYLKRHDLMFHLHFLLAFEGSHVYAEFLDAMPEAALVDAEDFGRFDLNAA